jgi:hypothetical protein
MSTTLHGLLDRLGAVVVAEGEAFTTLQTTATHRFCRVLEHLTAALRKYDAVPNDLQADVDEFLPAMRRALAVMDGRELSGHEGRFQKSLRAFIEAASGE